MKVRYMPETPTNEQCAHCLAAPLYRIGDCVLVWVNEGDIIRDGEKLLPVSENEDASK